MDKPDVYVKTPGKEKMYLGIIVVLLIAIGIFAMVKYNDSVEEKKAAELLNATELGVLSGFQQTAIEITQTGNIPVVTNNTIKWIPISQLCGGQ